MIDDNIGAQDAFDRMCKEGSYPPHLRDVLIDLQTLREVTIARAAWQAAAEETLDKLTRAEAEIDAGRKAIAGWVNRLASLEQKARLAVRSWNNARHITCTKELLDAMSALRTELDAGESSPGEER